MRVSAFLCRPVPLVRWRLIRIMPVATMRAPALAAQEVSANLSQVLLLCLSRQLLWRWCRRRCCLCLNPWQRVLLRSPDPNFNIRAPPPIWPELKARISACAAPRSTNDFCNRLEYFRCNFSVLDQLLILLEGQIALHICRNAAAGKYRAQLDIAIRSNCQACLLCVMAEQLHQCPRHPSKVP